MKTYVRIGFVIVLVAVTAMLARNQVAWAGRVPRELDQSELASVQGFVWNDADQDGLQDEGESGIQNVTVNILDKTKTFINAALTDAAGRYQFDGLAPGDYYFDFAVPIGFSLSPEHRGQDEALDSDADVITGETNLVQLVAGNNILTWDVGMYSLGSLSDAEPGTVKPPPGEITFCEDGVHSVGGVSILEVTNLAPGYCIVAFLRDRAFAVGRIPNGAGEILAEITFVRIFYYGELVYQLPEKDGQGEICYSVVSGKTSQIYFFNFYGPRFGERSGQPAWEPLETTLRDGMLCAQMQTTGAYALIGQ
jgi:hypothetical protein